MSELDLDALEREMADYAEATGTSTEFFIDTPRLKALIQRLQEAEAQLAEIRSKWDYGDRLIHRNEQLERVREAAQAVVDAFDYYEPLNGAALRAALAAVEEPAKA